jgi:endonuclease/exonuclease/phosphatase family metal-dependent hydrolase
MRPSRKRRRQKLNRALMRVPFCGPQLGALQFLITAVELMQTTRVKILLGFASVALGVASMVARPFTVVAYNGEHLFDVDGVARIEEYQPASYSRAHALTKFQNAARVLANFENGRGPDILILSELEVDFTPAKTTLDYDRLLAQYAHLTLPEMLGAKFNREIADLPAEVFLAQALAERGVTGHRIVVAEEAVAATDGRGIEHKNAVFTRFPVKSTRSHRTQAARAILEVVVDVDGAPLHVFANHWKSGASDPATEGLRIANAKTLRARVEEILSADPNADIILGGDFNSHYNQKQRYPKMPRTGMNDVLRSQGNEAAVLGRQHDLYNLWFELPAPERGSDTFRGEWGTLVHLIVSRGLYDYRGVQYVDNSFAVAKFPGLNMDASGLPMRWSFDGPAGSGFSDHFPVSARFITVTEGTANRYLTLKNPSVERAGPAPDNKIAFAKVDLAKVAVRAENLPKGASIRSDAYKGKIFRVEGRVAPGARLAVEFRGETIDIWTFDEALRKKLRTEYRTGESIRFYGELGQYRDRWQFVIQDPTWIK